jgi:hypothetical protein
MKEALARMLFIENSKLRREEEKRGSHHITKYTVGS